MTDSERLEFIQKHLFLHGPNPQFHEWVFVPGRDPDLRAVLDRLIEKISALDTNRTLG